MVEKIWDILNYIFPVYVIDRMEVLIIEDRRPTLLMLLSALAMLAMIVYAISSLPSIRIGEDIWFIVGMGAIILFLGVVVSRGTFREIYVFDKPRDTYTFTRQSVLKKDVLQGSLSQFRAVYVGERRRDDSRMYMVALLQQGMLLGASETQILRENPPVFNSRFTELRIATAISKFLNIECQGVVDVV